MSRAMAKAVSATSLVDSRTSLDWRHKLLLPFVSISKIQLRQSLANLMVDGVLAFATITLAIKVPRIANAKTQQVAVLAWAGVVLLMYSFLLSIFRFKNGGYPFFLPPF
jgi:hypothetical protein